MLVNVACRIESSDLLVFELAERFRTGFVHEKAG